MGYISEQDERYAARMEAANPGPRLAPAEGLSERVQKMREARIIELERRVNLAAKTLDKLRIKLLFSSTGAQFDTQEAYALVKETLEEILD